MESDVFTVHYARPSFEKFRKLLGLPFYCHFMVWYHVRWTDITELWRLNFSKGRRVGPLPLGVNVVGILGDAEADPESLVRGEEYGVHWGGIWARACIRLLPRKKLNFSLETEFWWINTAPPPEKKVELFAWNGVLVNYERYFWKYGDNLH